MKEMEPAFNRLSKTKGGTREQKVFQIKISASAAPLQLSHLRVREDYRNGLICRVVQTTVLVWLISDHW
jgi:hypothetical protein